MFVTSDPLAWGLAALIAALALTIGRFAARAFAGDPRRREFLGWLTATSLSALVIILTTHLLVLALAWLTTSLCLHRLLVFYPDRPAAVMAARMKFLISRAGDVCVFALVAVAWHTFGTWDLGTLLTRAAATPDTTHTIAVLAVAAALLKSAQFPFHAWLPETMDTPTPVSALMHAGVINAGGILVLRMSPIVAASTPALTLLLIVGGVTAVFGAISTLTQTSVKRSLAYSTIAQMGFLFVECGLGAFGAAALHLAAHACYKATAFLSSGTAVAEIARRRQRTPTPASARWLAPFAAVAMTALVMRAAGIHAMHDIGTFALAAVFATALAVFLADAWPARNWRGVTRGLAAGTALAVAFAAGHRVFEFLAASPVATWPLTMIGAMAIVGLAVTAYVVHAAAPALAQKPWIRVLYVHAHNGFYAGTVATRLVERFWPTATPGPSRATPLSQWEVAQ